MRYATFMKKELHSLDTNYCPLSEWIKAGVPSKDNRLRENAITITLLLLIF